MNVQRALTNHYRENDPSFRRLRETGQMPAGPRPLFGKYAGVAQDIANRIIAENNGSR